MSAAAQDRVLTREEAAERCRVSTWTLMRWRRLGIGPKPMRVGPRFIRYSAAEVDRWLDACEQESGGAA